MVVQAVVVFVVVEVVGGVGREGGLGLGGEGGVGWGVGHGAGSAVVLDVADGEVACSGEEEAVMGWLARFHLDLFGVS